MILLRSLGSSDLIAGDRPGASAVLTQPKRFALLVYLAIAGARGFVRRDTLLALFWPETDQARGRKVLRQTVYLLRQSLGADVITNRGDEELGVDAAALHCDVVLFDAALAGGQTAAALDHYRGDFLAGFHVPDASPDLEEWIHAERTRLRTAATNAAWTLALSDESAGNKAGAASWVRRSLELDWLNESRVRDGMQLLTRVGDRAGALRAYEKHARRAHEDLGMAPGAEVQKLAGVLRAPADVVESAARASEPDSAAPLPAQNEGIRFLPPAAPQTQRSARNRRVLLWAIPIAAALVLGGIFLRNAGGGGHVPIIAVGPINNVAPGSGPPSNVTAELLSTSLARVSGVQVIPLARLYDVQSQLRAARRPVTSTLAAAKQAGAEELIQGTMRTDATGKVHIDVQMLDSRSGAVRRVFRGEGPDLFSAVDDATAQIAQGYGALSPQGHLADVTSQSLVAHSLYDQGLQAFYHEDPVGALQLFRAALAEDTTFAMAAYYAASVAHVYGRRIAPQLMLQAARLAHRTNDRDRLFILERLATNGMSVTAGAFADTMVQRYPLDPDAHFAYGKLLERRGDFAGAAGEYRRVIAMDSLSLKQQARCLGCEAYEALWWSYLFADSMNAAEAVAREYARARPGTSSHTLVAVTLERLGRTTDAWTQWRTVDSLATGSIDHDVIAAKLAIRSGDFSAADERLRRAVTDGKTARREEAAWYLTISLRNQGRLQTALATARQASNPLPVGIVQLELERPAESARTFQRYLPPIGFDSFPGHAAKHQTWMLTHIATSLAAAGDTARLPAIADSVEQLGQRSALGRDHRLHHYVRGLLWNARGQRARAVKEFRASIWSWPDGYTRANYELAKDLLLLGRAREAVYPLQAALRGDLESSNLYMSRTELHELLANVFDRLNQQDSAAVHYRAVVNAWRQADPQFAARREAAQLRLNALRPRKASENGTPRQIS